MRARPQTSNLRLQIPPGRAFCQERVHQAGLMYSLMFSILASQRQPHDDPRRVLQPTVMYSWRPIAGDAKL